MNRVGLKRGDHVVLLIAVAIAVFCCIQIWLPRAEGETVVVTSPAGEKRYALAQDRTVTVQGEQDIVLTVEIVGGRARVRESRCPDQVCVNSGWLSQNGQVAACVPAGVSVRIVGEPVVDGVTA
ncbi:MAG: NusG domain II-containing protein [Clostridia bacterium]|nr:NusG domain II-containing protein [Clostridia bacterium]